MTDYASRYGTLEGQMIAVQIALAAALDCFHRGEPEQARRIVQMAHAEVCRDIREISAWDAAELAVMRAAGALDALASKLEQELHSNGGTELHTNGGTK